MSTALVTRAPVSARQQLMTANVAGRNKVDAVRLASSAEKRRGRGHPQHSQDAKEPIPTHFQKKGKATVSLQPYQTKKLQDPCFEKPHGKRTMGFGRETLNDDVPQKLPRGRRHMDARESLNNTTLSSGFPLDDPARFKRQASIERVRQERQEVCQPRARGFDIEKFDQLALSRKDTNKSTGSPPQKKKFHNPDPKARVVPPWGVEA